MMVVVVVVAVGEEMLLPSLHDGEYGMSGCAEEEVEGEREGEEG
jgi:hypothetical protein